MPSKLVTCSLWAVAFINVGTSLWLSIPAFLSSRSSLGSREYSYIGEDYPLFFPVDEVGPASMALYDSTHFSLLPNTSSVLDTEYKLADDEWEISVSKPDNVGRVRMGPENRVFVVAVSHQLHCLRRIQMALLDRDNPLGTSGHIKHCLNYLRQTFLCEAIEGTEQGDFMSQDYDSHEKYRGPVDDLACHDWERVYDAMEENYGQWLEWKRT
ncbi:hypothetical protein BDP27DRAFT_1267990 [Rhodocollybia butyracea]|uniref:Oxidase ustYa n=1 Tax=Rhodocollybia butyracea TaxID=206335 RepID=A0A9P5U6K7_9AGAR|nr:hypothetical protein BDP27DRAFT_1267990 [Rhodocollybia butyracea]